MWRSATRRPPSDTPTLADVGGDVTKISTDDEPVEAFYETSIADAVAAKEPFVVAFATPKFCQSQQCGPTLDRLKPIAAAHPDVTFINVEPYQLEVVDGQLQPVLTGDPAQLTPAACDRRVAAPQRAVGLRGRPRRDRDRVVHADLQRRGARGRGQPPSSSGHAAGVLEPHGEALVALHPVVDDHGLGRRLVLREVPGRELVPVLELAEPELDRSRRPAGAA